MLDMTTKFHFAIHLGTAEPIEPKNSVLNQNGRLSVSFQSWFLDSFFLVGLHMLDMSPKFQGAK